jgi:predicted aspartyl protease
MKLAYDAEHFDPPAPVLPLVVSGPADEDRAELVALVDTGADVSLIPIGLARALALPTVDRIDIVDLGHDRHPATVHAAVVRIGRHRRLVRLTAFGEEALIGRDLLGALLLTLDGPTTTLGVRVPRRRRA